MASRSRDLLGDDVSVTASAAASRRTSRPLLRPASRSPRRPGPAARIAQVSYLYNGVMKQENIDAAWAWVSFWVQLPWGMLSAGGMISILPPVILFALAQRTMVQGLTAGTIKG